MGPQIFPAAQIFIGPLLSYAAEINFGLLATLIALTVLQIAEGYRFG
jgi:hypothetical protein